MRQGMISPYIETGSKAINRLARNNIVLKLCMLLKS
jgi:hypothetical protein